MLSMPSRDERRDPTHPTVSLFDREVAPFVRTVFSVFKWSRRGHQAADLIAGSVAKYASSGV
jgi:hypothetical protein